jgi:glycosyltransferase involved in cell wall biosynthesis
LPVVTTAQGGAQEIVDESCGVLVPPGDAVGVANALRKLVEEADARSALGAGGPRRARLLCDPTAILRRLETVLTPLSPRQKAA